MEHQLRLPCLCPEIAQAHTSITTLAAFSLYVCVSRLLRECVPVSSSKMAIGSKIELGRVISILFVFFVKLFFFILVRSGYIGSIVMSFLLLHQIFKQGLRLPGNSFSNTGIARLMVFIP